MGVGPESLNYDELRHIGFQKEISNLLRKKREEGIVETKTIQERLHDRYKKKSIYY